MRILYSPDCFSQQRQREKKVSIYPVLLAMEAEWHRQQGDEVIWGYPTGRNIPEGLPFLTLPAPDRVFTRAKEYTSGNYKYLPGTHIMSASGCWHGKCVFCVENKGVITDIQNTQNGLCVGMKPKPYEVRPVEDVINEIEECRRLGFKEVFDDSATFPTGRWLQEFLKRCHNLGITLSCNMRISNSLDCVDFSEMKQAGFRMLLFGIESANQRTLNRIGKGINAEDIIPTVKKAAEAGLEPHIAVMFGYPWETDADARRTIRLVHYLLRKGYARTAQASFYTTPDVQSNERHRKFIKQIYYAGLYPSFWWYRRHEDVSYLWRGIKAWLNV